MKEMREGREGREKERERDGRRWEGGRARKSKGWKPLVLGEEHY